MATTAINRELVQLIAEEMASGVEMAVEYWMIEIDEALTDMRLTTMGRLNAVREIVENYKNLTGKPYLNYRKDDYRITGALGSS